jgi:broad specificity phosphatase PhoE
MRAVQTAATLVLRAEPESLLCDCDYGRWAGRSLADVERDEPNAMAQWLGDPAAAPHGGESITALIERAGRWLAGLNGLSGQLVAVTHPSVIRAVLVHALDAPPQTFWRVDVPPLAIVDLAHNGLRWALAFRGMT